MAQNFRRYTLHDIGTTAKGVPSDSTTFDSYDTIVGINVANVTDSSIEVDVYINDGTNDIYLVKAAPISAGGALQVLDGGAKFVVQNGDKLLIKSSVATSADAWISTVDDISS